MSALSRTRSQKRQTVISVTERLSELLDEISEELIAQRWQELTREIDQMLAAYKKLQPILEAAIEDRHPDKAFDFREFTEGLEKLKGYLEDAY